MNFVSGQQVKLLYLFLFRFLELQKSSIVSLTGSIDSTIQNGGALNATFVRAVSATFIVWFLMKCSLETHGFKIFHF